MNSIIKNRILKDVDSKIEISAEYLSMREDMFSFKGIDFDYLNLMKLIEEEKFDEILWNLFYCDYDESFEENEKFIQNNLYFHHQKYASGSIKTIQKTLKELLNQELINVPNSSSNLKK